ncbi:hypothetical protein RRG08_021334 [Elysia crispata]|uniref:Uncharacterized protein n=1 Tax=Elysia crispata TaxID=231223 RepID=A0AAE1AYB4_9GAST|nr:hypothetical protein RRG08_021334 [Elysia crispata]
MGVGVLSQWQRFTRFRYACPRLETVVADEGQEKGRDKGVLRKPVLSCPSALPSACLVEEKPGRCGSRSSRFS